ncbi:hypothetical protein CFC21_034838 [Triticum aestivum]|uniref:Uncharacterized protein n=3 Tax=Triticum TaxID=4564 RepID=A0A9R0RFL4_TRITD|nr:uncharacterized protein LOC119267713 [Triticum dicoccoides]XP_044339608.1 uncharacterized protein LOC123060826 [Triticum aestivum]KAF7021985.1 hypothetical protein CFC21_034838 [Triticum aestivum]VAH59391.1 unnamed protein product [Triticum turgidum subsp. durum]
MAASLWLPSPPLHSAVFLSTNHSPSPSPPLAPASTLLQRKHAPARARGNLACSSSGSSSSSASSVVTKDQEGAAAAAEATAPAPAPAAVRYDYKDDPNFRGCKGCGREETERGCNGEGRIMGGIAAVPLFGWWPIKAYRPCPGFVASGGRYRRYGQSMDDVIAGKGRKVASDKKKSDK